MIFMNPALLLPLLGRKAARLVELLEQDLDHALELALLSCRKMIKIGAHLKDRS